MSMTDEQIERERFEAWAESKDRNVCRYPDYVRFYGGQYMGVGLQDVWQGWLARAQEAEL